jgi:hypothetical protein
MEKKHRNRTLYWSDAADLADRIGYVLLLLCCIGAMWQESGPEIGIAAGFVLVGLLRIRMLIRAIRVDALLREAEEEARRENRPTS